MVPKVSLHYGTLWWKRVEVDLLHGLDLAGLRETTELGDGLPLLLLALCSATGATTVTAALSTLRRPPT